MTARRLLTSLLVAPLGMGLACERSIATAEQCGRILDRIVDIELDEQGFRDPILGARKKAEMRRLLASELRHCVGASLSPEAIACVARARTIEELSHICLR